MTKLIQQLNFSSSNYYYESAIEPNPTKEKKYFGDGASLSTAGSKRSAVSASDAECFSLCLGGPDVPALGSAPPGGAAGGAAGPVTPSTPPTPTHADNRDLLSALLWASASSLCGSAESLTDAPRPAFQYERREEVISKILDRKDRMPVKVDFKIYLTENTCTRWEAVVSNNKMYLRVPSVLQSGSKESFMLLLDFAEERLACEHCIICVLKSRPDRATLLRTFMFMGFQMVPPNSPVMPLELSNPDYLFLHYNMQ